LTSDWTACGRSVDRATFGHGSHSRKTANLQDLVFDTRGSPNRLAEPQSARQPGLRMTPDFTLHGYMFLPRTADAGRPLPMFVTGRRPRIRAPLDPGTLEFDSYDGTDLAVARHPQGQPALADLVHRLERPGHGMLFHGVRVVQQPSRRLAPAPVPGASDGGHSNCPRYLNPMKRSSSDRIRPLAAMCAPPGPAVEDDRLGTRLVHPAGYPAIARRDSLARLSTCRKVDGRPKLPSSPRLPARRELTAAVLRATDRFLFRGCCCFLGYRHGPSAPTGQVESSFQLLRTGQKDRDRRPGPESASGGLAGGVGGRSARSVPPALALRRSQRCLERR